jgi:tetratricopeptide (TPR) repeat protein
MYARAAAPLSLRAMLGFACLLTQWLPSTVKADQSSSSSPVAQTRAEVAEGRHRAGVAAYAKGHYRDAIDLFLEANRIRPSAALSFNVARCYEQLDDASNELSWYRDYIRRSDRASDSKQVTRLIARLEKRLAQKGVQQVSVSSSPLGATVLIDGSPVGVAPWTGDLAPGTHSIELTLRGYEDLSQRFDLPREHAVDIGFVLASERAAERTRPLAVTDKHLAIEVQRPQVSTNVSGPTSGDAGSLLTPLGWTILGTGGATLGGALVFELLRHGAEKDAQHETRQIQFAQDVEKMRSLQTVARVLAGAGATLALAGGTLLIVGASEHERAPSARVTVSCARYRCNASLLGRF